MPGSRTPQAPPGWSRRAVLTGATTAAAAALAGGATACSDKDQDGSDDNLKNKIQNPSSNFNAQGFPIVGEPITLQYMTARFASAAKDYNKVANWKHYRKKTNIKISWGLVPFEDQEEKRNLALNSGDYPEIFDSMGFTVRDAAKYGRQGIFVHVGDLIDKYMPNLKKWMTNDDTIRRGMTFPDGKIYGFPHIVDPDFLAMRIQFKQWIREDWLDKFDMATPTTTQEYYEFLKAVKKRRPNGKSQAIGYGDRFAGGTLRKALMGSFGVGNRGSSYIDAEPENNEKVRFYPITDRHKALIEYLHQLYTEKLMAQNIFSIDPAKLGQAMSKGVYGSSMNQTPPTKNFKYTPMPALKGPDNHHAYNQVQPSLGSLGEYMITDKCKHPVEAARWLDYFYSNNGALLFFMGIEGESYKKTNNGVEYTDKIQNADALNKALAPYVTYMGVNYAGIVKEKFFKGAESSPPSIKAAKLLEPDAQMDIWPSFKFTSKEAEKLDSLADDIEKYVDESTDRFIKGDLHLNDWKKYVDKLKGMGLDEYTEIQQAAYDRYREA